MENVFAELGPQINADPLEKELIVKPKRSAFVFITAECDSCNSALEDLRKIDEVQEVYLAKGAYDLVARVNGDSLDDLREIISRRIRNLGSIKSTLTLTLI